MMQTKSREEALAVLSPKVQGTEWIRDCIGVPELDFVLLCSSISAVIPSIGLSDYAAANAYLDGFAAAYDDPNGTTSLCRSIGIRGEMSAWPYIRNCPPRWLIFEKTN